MYRFILILLLLGVASCTQSKMFDAKAAMRWSRTECVEKREQPCTYSYQRSDGSWITISTSKLIVSGDGLEPEWNSILPRGFMVYPGGLLAETITDAIEVASKISYGFRAQP